MDGWKAIAAYLGRDRSTVIRWAKSRGLPVRSVPGGRLKTVYALQTDLDEWLRQRRDDPEPLDDAVAQEDREPEPEVPPGVKPAADPEPDTTGRARKRVWVLAGCAAAALATVAAAYGPGWQKPANESARVERPGEVLLSAADDIERRDAASLGRAVARLERTVRFRPDDARAHAMLADAYILMAEFGHLPAAVALRRARAASDAAARLDPNLAAVHRARGYFAYWCDRDRVAAGRAFRTAVARDPADGRTRLWFASALADNGENEAAAEQFREARRLAPGSPAVATDEAWATWARGDMSGYLSELRLRADARGEAELLAYAAALEAAARTGDARAVHRLMISRAVAAEAGAPYPDHAYAAFIAHVAGDGETLKAILEAAERNDEHWGSSGYVSRMTTRWAKDPEIRALLTRRKASRLG